MLEITEIIQRAKQGRTKPFLCEASDKKKYYVKGKAATISGLIKEWMGAQLAQGFNLPVPTSEILYVDERLVAAFGDKAKNSLGGGYVFGSEQVTSVTELKYQQVSHIDQSLRKDVLIFDLWMRNEDRTLTTLGGNPNLLWDAAKSKLSVIDHNLIFDPDFNKSDFWATHVFHQSLISSCVDLVERTEYQTKMQKTLELWSGAWSAIPEEWIEENEELKMIDQNMILQQLEVDAQGNIWTQLP